MQPSITLITLVTRDDEETIAFLAASSILRQSNILTSPDRTNGGTNGTNLLLARTATATQEAFVGRQTGGRVFLFLNTDDFWRDYQAMVAAGRERTVKADAVQQIQ